MSMIKTVLENLEERTPLTIVSHGNIRNPSLRRILLEKLKVPYGEDGSFLAEPFFEGMFPWTNSKESLTDLVKSKRLHPLAEKAIRETLPPEAKFLRLHQQQALEAVANGKSIVVTTGTGSGKTECFLYPIIDALCRELDTAPRGPLQGVRALFLYPLNALIESQRKRFEQICRGASPESRIRFAMFNGNTPSRGRTRPQDLPELLYKQEIRAFEENQTPPNLLVTNSTMLELALVRKEDQQIFEKSQGKLRFVVLDEAHTYMGSDAAELAMRLRRTLHAFGIEPKDVRFIATSATTGDDTERLQDFLAQIAGISKQDVEVIGGKRSLPSVESKGSAVSVQQVLDADSEDPVALHGLLSRCAPAMELRSQLHVKGRLSLRDISTILKVDQRKALEFLDRASQAVPSKGSFGFFLPLKSHLFQRSFQGAWACWNPECNCKDPLLGEDWLFGQIYLEAPRRIPNDKGIVPTNWDKCKCGSNLFEVLTCNHCGEPLLGAQEHDLELSLPGLTEDELEESSDEPDEEEDSEEGSEEGSNDYRPVLVATSRSEKSKPVTSSWCQTGEAGSPKVRSRDLFFSTDAKVPVRCPACEHPIYLKKSMPKRSSFPLSGSNLSSPRVSSKALYHGLARLVLRCDEATESSKPQKGRRMLGFTDNRQGTAYHAASQGLQSEISATRVWLLDELVKQCGTCNSVDDRIRQEVEKRAQLKQCDPALLYANEDYMDGLREKFPAENAINWISFNEVQKRIESRLKGVLATLEGKEEDISKWLHLPEGLQQEHVNCESVAELLLWRELSFRTRRKKNLETLGLLRVDYGLETQIQRGLEAFRGDLPKTRNFLKILLDYGFRAQGSLDSRWNEKDITACYGTRAIKKPFDVGNARYGVSAAEPKKRRWVEVLAEALLKAEGLPSDWTALRNLMAQAIELLKTAGYLSDCLELKRNHLRLQLPDQVWLCPVTKTLLDEPVGIGENRFSPYSVSQIQKEPVKIDRESLAVPNTLDGLKAWAASAPDWWTDLHSDVFEVDPDDAYIVAQEHSAQLEKNALKDHQDHFSTGCINLLNCSTTMEMGVDIGSISLVAMTNVPPYSHNYLQRAGRAGRGNQGQSLVWTLSGAGAHDRQAWSNPLDWVNKSAYRPQVSLDSRRIAQRHLHAWLFGMWMKEFGQGIKKPAQWFLGYRQQGIRTKLSDVMVSDDPAIVVLNAVWKLMTDPDLDQAETLKDEKLLKITLRNASKDSLSEDFLDWLVSADRKIPESLVARTPLQGVSYRQIAVDAVEAFRNARERWLEDVERICSVICSVTNPAGQWRLIYELKRLGDNPLATFLAEKGALPMNSLPSEVVQLSLNQKPKNKKGRKELGKDGRKKSYSNFPSRERPIAIREYAPGCGVIIDGKVHTVQYVVRNWKLLPGAAPDPQTLRTVKLCHECGAARVSTAQMGGSEEACPECKASLSFHSSRKMLVPSGFIADRRVTRSFEDVQRSSYEIPRIGMHNGSLRQPIQDGGEMRAGRATVVYLNGGGWQQPKDSTEPEAPKRQAFGPASVMNVPNSHAAQVNQDDHFHVCMECGYSVTTPSVNQHSTLGLIANANPLANHKRWSQADKAFMACPGANKPSGDPVHQVVSLGALQETDAFSLQLPRLTGEESRKAALTWALALRNVLARSLDIRKEELGWTARKGTKGWSMLVFDRAPGGADFAPKAMDRLPKLFREARAIMQACNCETVCHNCLLDREVQAQWNDLDRKKALDAIPESFVDQLGLPEHLKFWGESSRACHRTLAVEILSRIRQESGELRIYLRGEPGDWSFDDWTFADSLRDWKRGVGKSVRILVTKENVERAQDHYFLFSELISFSGSHLEVVESLPRLAQAEACLEAEFVQGNKSTQWIHVLKDGKVSIDSSIGSNWGATTEDSLILCGEKEPSSLGKVTQLTLRDVFPQDALIWDVESKNRCMISNFAGSIFANQKFIEWWGNKRDIRPEKLIYSDIYLRNPLNFSLLLKIVEFFDPKAVVVRNSDRNPDRNGRGWNGDYSDSSKSDAVLTHLLQSENRKLVIEHPAYLPHERILILEYGNGSAVRIDIGKGLGYWRMLSSTISGPIPNSDRSESSDATIIRNVNVEVIANETAHFYARKLS